MTCEFLDLSTVSGSLVNYLYLKDCVRLAMVTFVLFYPSTLSRSLVNYLYIEDCVSLAVVTFVFSYLFTGFATFCGNYSEDNGAVMWYTGYGILIE